MYTAHITIMPLQNLLDPQGKAVLGGLENLGIKTVNDVRVGKHITLQLNANSTEEAKQIAETAAQKLLANGVMEQYEIVVTAP
jgi:phosphoribosylformylglycinamidine synthase subunit PurS